MVKKKIVLKRKVDLLPNTSSSSEKDIPKVKREQFNKFSYAYVDIKGTAEESGFLREWYEELFDEFPPWEKYPLPLICAKIQYELIKRDYESSKISIPKKIYQNWKASQEFNINGFTECQKTLVNININKEKGGDTMAKKSTGSKKKVIKKGGGKTIGVADFVCNLLAENIKRKLNDTVLAERITKAYPDRAKRDEAYIKKHRSIFNSGDFPSQNGKTPKQKLEQFGKNVAKKVKTKKEKIVKKEKTGKPKKRILLKRKK